MVLAFPLLHTDLSWKSRTFSVVMSSLLLSSSNAFFISNSVAFNFHLVLTPHSSAELLLFFFFWLGLEACGVLVPHVRA